jgi:hypothetical protein
MGVLFAAGFNNHLLSPTGNRAVLLCCKVLVGKDDFIPSIRLPPLPPTNSFAPITVSQRSSCSLCVCVAIDLIAREESRYGWRATNRVPASTKLRLARIKRAPCSEGAGDRGVRESAGVAHIPHRVLMASWKCRVKVAAGALREKRRGGARWLACLRMSGPRTVTKQKFGFL